jgi:hypothetical protein
MKVTVFCDAKPCCLVQRQSRGLFFPKMETANSSTTLINFCHTTWHKVPDDRIFIAGNTRTAYDVYSLECSSVEEWDLLRKAQLLIGTHFCSQIL